MDSKIVIEQLSRFKNAYEKALLDKKRSEKLGFDIKSIRELQNFADRKKYSSI